jgi:hypothetical protein
MVGAGIPLAWVDADEGVWPQLKAVPGLPGGPQGYVFAGLLNFAVTLPSGRTEHNHGVTGLAGARSGVADPLVRGG